MADLTSTSEIADALQLADRNLVSLVGGGGKTTVLFALGAQLAGTTVMTTTTKMGSSRTEGHRMITAPDDDELIAELREHRRVLVWHEIDGNRSLGVHANTCDRWFGNDGSQLADNVIVEADGSRRKPFKSPAQHEPVIPHRTTILVACIGASALGRTIAEVCHRPELVAEIAQCSTHDALTPARAATVLLSDNGSKKHQPPDSRFAVAVCQVRPEERPAVDELVSRLDDQCHVVGLKHDPAISP